MTDTFQWERCLADGTGCADIPGETGSTYLLAAADVGKRVRVRGSRDGVLVGESQPTTVVEATGAGGTVAWTGDFETGDFSQYTDVTQGYHNAVVSGSKTSLGGPSAARKGTYYYQSETHSGDNIAGGERCEIIKGSLGIADGVDEWYGWSADEPSSLPANGLTGQFHSNSSLPNEGQANIQFFIDHGQVGAFGATSANPRWVLGVNGGTGEGGQYVSRPFSKAFDLGLLSDWKGAGWIDLVFHIVWKNTLAGTVELWAAKGGGAYVKKVSEIGMIANLYVGYSAYLKLGLNRTQSSGLPTAYLWFDEVKQGDSFAAVDPS